MNSWLLGNLGGPERAAVRVAIACDVALSTFDSLRGGSHADPRQLLDARLKELRRRHKLVRDSLPVQPHTAEGALSFVRSQALLLAQGRQGAPLPHLMDSSAHRTFMYVFHDLLGFSLYSLLLSLFLFVLVHRAYQR